MLDLVEYRARIAEKSPRPDESMVEKLPTRSMQFGELAIGRFHSLHSAGEQTPALGGMEQARLVLRRTFGFGDTLFRPRTAFGVAGHEPDSDCGKGRMSIYSGDRELSGQD